MSILQIQLLNTTLLEVSEILDLVSQKNPSIEEEFAFTFSLMVNQCQTQAEDLLSQLKFAESLAPTKAQSEVSDNQNPETSSGENSLQKKNCRQSTESDESEFQKKDDNLSSISDDSIRENFQNFVSMQNIEKFDHNNSELNISITSLLSMKGNKYDELDDLLMNKLEESLLEEDSAQSSLVQEVLQEAEPRRLTLKEKIALKKNPIEEFRMQMPVTGGPQHNSASSSYKSEPNSEKKKVSSQKSTTCFDSDGSEFGSSKKSKIANQRRPVRFSVAEFEPNTPIVNSATVIPKSYPKKPNQKAPKKAKTSKFVAKPEPQGYIDPSVIAFNEKQKLNTLRNCRATKIVKTPFLYCCGSAQTKFTVNNSKKDSEVIKTEFLSGSDIQAKLRRIQTLEEAKKKFNKGLLVVSTEDEFRKFKKDSKLDNFQKKNILWFYFDVDAASGRLNGIVIMSYNSGVCFNLSFGLTHHQSFLQWLSKILSDPKIQKISHNTSQILFKLDELFPKQNLPDLCKITDVFSTSSEKMDFPAFFTQIPNKNLTVQEINSAYFETHQNWEFEFDCNWEDFDTKTSLTNLVSAFRHCQAIIDIYIFQCRNREILLNNFDRPRMANLQKICLIENEKFLAGGSLGGD